MLFTELALVFSFTALLLSLADLFGQSIARLLIVLLLTISVLASYYMTFFNVVIGYGVVQAVLTTDVYLSKEAVGVGLLVWFVVLAVLPMLLWWRYVGVKRQPVVGWVLRFKQFAAPLGLVVLFAATFATIAQRVNSDPESPSAVGQDIGQASLAAHTYVPSNWVAGLGMSARAHNRSMTACRSGASAAVTIRPCIAYSAMRSENQYCANSSPPPTTTAMTALLISTISVMVKTT